MYRPFVKGDVTLFAVWPQVCHSPSLSLNLLSSYGSLHNLPCWNYVSYLL